MAPTLKWSFTDEDARIMEDSWGVTDMNYQELSPINIVENIRYRGAPSRIHISIKFLTTLRDLHA